MIDTKPTRPLTVLQPSRSVRMIKISELWRYKDLIFVLCWRDFTVRYKQTYLGVAWAVLVPFLTMIVFTLIFGKLAKMPSDGLPYPIFLYTALLPWQLFARALGQASDSLVGNQTLIKKAHFPRLVLPVVGALQGVPDFVIAFAVLGAMMVFYGIAPAWGIVLLPVLVLYGLIVALAVGLWLAALNVDYRDVRYVIPFMTQLWFFATPVVYPGSVLDEPWRTLLGLNPMTGVIESFRWALLGSNPPHLAGLVISFAMTGCLLVGGLVYFGSKERYFADRI